MNLRQKLLLTITGLVVLIMAAVTLTVSMRTRIVLEQIEQDRAEALMAEVHGEFQRQGNAISAALTRLSVNERVQHIAFDSAQGGDQTQYVHEAAALAQQYQLDFLEIVNSEGTILSSAQAPARFGYHEQLAAQNGPFLQNIETSNGTVLGLVCQRQVIAGATPIYVVGGRKLDSDFLRSLPLPDGMYVWFYGSNQFSLDPKKMIATTPVPMANFADILPKALASGNDVRGMVRISNERFDHADVQAMPLKDQNSTTSAVLLVGSSRRPMLELIQHIRAIAFAITGIGILLAIVASLWVAGIFSRPIEQLASASREVAAGNLNVQVEPSSKDELGELAESFNRMTHELLEQRERLVQTERVAAWRELARRLAHELKNPLFPLQITVENLLRSRDLPPAEFEEVFQECAHTLLDEIMHLKAIISRFSDFSKMPQPQLQTIQINTLLEKSAALHRPQLQGLPHTIKLNVELDPQHSTVMLDPDLMHRVLSNLILNAIDAMPAGGTLTVATRAEGDSIIISVSDTGVGLTPEERDRLFTPYYTSKQHGTGLGLAIVQSVVSDHHGTISVQSAQGSGTTFIIRLPREAQGKGESTGAKA